MAASVRFATDDDLDGIWDNFRIAFGIRTPAGRDREMGAVRPENVAVVDGNAPGEIAAAAHVRRFRQWFGGRAVPLGGYSPVAVLPQHRSRGLGRLVTAAHLPVLRDEGIPIAALYPASVAFYRSVGFEIAGSYVQRRVPAAHLSAIPAAPGIAVRRATPDDLPAVRRRHLASAPAIDGALDRDDAMWHDLFPGDLAGVELYVVDDPSVLGELAGYGAFRLVPGRSPYEYAVRAMEVMTDDPAVRRALWQVIGSSGSQAPDVEVAGNAEDPIFLLTGSADPEAVRTEIRWMLRIVDLPEAFLARGWNPAARAEVHLEVEDPHAPWNAGRWTVAVDGGAATIEPGGRGDIRLGIGALSCWWAGYQSAVALAAHGAIATDDPRRLRVLDGLLAGGQPRLIDFY